ncbi:MFS general substrate transporter [Coprinopsis marcescibilis]|uniref:MFS general substrate transporter n=1 Tax=Coprinopsis marcescibilis TaxID=230819 RepID=A0A5C3KM73_COPMA|nr:MFS general substrate transporter [Coprinopsis marcescibilis]
MSVRSAIPTAIFLKRRDLEKRVWLKMDLWILPVVTMFYLLSFLDRTNLGNARVAGLQKDLAMTNYQYSIALTVTYIPYIVAELPSNLLLKAVGPNLMLPTMLTLWGVVTVLQGIVSSYRGLLIARFFLGLLEGGVLPGLVLYLSSFYPRRRLQWRISIFFSAASLSGAFSGLLAFGIINMDGIGSRPGWAWIFILEGLFTFVFGLLSFALLPRSPGHSRFLTKEEKDYVAATLRDDGVTSPDEKVDSFSWKEVVMAFTLPHVWLISVIFFMDGTVLYGLAYFAPSIVQGLGHTPARTQLMSVPPFAVAFVLTMIGALVSDRYQCRGLVSMFAFALCIVGFTTFLSTVNNHVQYMSLFFSIAGVYLSAPSLSTWGANNAAPHIRRATAIAIGFIMTNSGGILATWLLGSLSPAPRYVLATKVLLGFSVAMFALTAVNILYLWDQNRRKKSLRENMIRSQEDPGLGDKSAWFIYAL